MSKKKYSPQCGPNLAFRDCENEPDNAILHKICGGMLVQDLGPSSQSHSKPDNTPGKVFCIKCGHKVSRAVSASLKIGKGRGQSFYFPDRNKYKLSSCTYLDVNVKSVLRYWEWTFKEIPGLSAAPGGQPESSTSIRWPPAPAHTRLSKKLRNIKRLLPKVAVDQEDDNWIIIHPLITLRIPKEQFSVGDAVKVESLWKSEINIDKTARELEKIAQSALGTKFLPVINPESFGIVEGTVVIIMHRPTWNLDQVNEFAANIKLLNFDQIYNAAEIFAAAHDKVLDSIAVEDIGLDEMEDEDPPLEEAVDPGEEVEINVPKGHGPFGAHSDMRVTHDKIIISYGRGAGSYWFLTLNREVWNNERAQEIRELVRMSTFSTPMDFVAKMASQARMMQQKADWDSFQVSLDFEEANAILFNRF